MWECLWEQHKIGYMFAFNGHVCPCRLNAKIVLGTPFVTIFTLHVTGVCIFQDKYIMSFHDMYTSSNSAVHTAFKPNNLPFPCFLKQTDIIYAVYFQLLKVFVFPLMTYVMLLLLFLPYIGVGF